MADTSTSDLIQQGLTAARVGDIEDARRLLEKATRQMPDNVGAWLGLAGVVDSLEEKQKCFAKALTLDPNNDEAKAGLALVEQKLAAQSIGSEVEAHGHAQHTTEVDTGVTVCYRHPQTETSLRCNRCNKPICPKCARRTPVGFRCPDCIREQENKYYSGGDLDYVIAAVIAFPLSLIAAGLFSFILSQVGWFFLILIIGFFVAPAVAGFIAEAVRWGVRKRRSRYLRHIVAACLILGTIPYLLLSLAGVGISLFAPGIFLVLGTATILARLR
jgi:hypothetical protein